MRRPGILLLTLAALSCGNGGGAPFAPPGADAGASCTPPPEYPMGAGQIPDFAFFGSSPSGAPQSYALDQYFEPCAPASRLLVLRLDAGWCGTCRWHAAHTQPFLTSDVSSRVRFVDVVLRNDDDDPPAQAFAATWQSRQDAPTDVALDPDFDTDSLIPPQATLPLYWMVDTRTMNLLATLQDPTPEALLDRARALIATLDGAAAPTPSPAAPLVDGRFTREEADIISAMQLAAAPPPDPSNAHADDPAAAALGASLFSDATLSPSGTVSCASCHVAAHAFADGLPTPTAGAGPGDRNTPSIALAAFARWQMWDGRADTLWMQATFPIEGPSELGSSRLFVAHAVAGHYASQYAAVFGALPDLSDATRFPPAGSPGDPAYDAMTPADQDTVTRILVDVAKAIAAHERTLRTQPLPIDAYAAGTTTALTDAQKDGLAAFFTAGCAQCHWGPRLTDDAFHNPRFPTGRHDGAADTGRKDGIPIFNASAFHVDGVYSDEADAGARNVPQVWDWTLGVFKTPALRGVTDTAPYGHGGTFPALADVVAAHAAPPLSPTDARAAGTRDHWFLPADASTQAAIVTFLQTLSLRTQ